MKNPPPPRHLGLPLTPPRAEIKNIRNVHQAKNRKRQEARSDHGGTRCSHAILQPQRPKDTKFRRGPKPPQIHKYYNITQRLHALFRKARTNFCLLLCDVSQEPSKDCSERLVQIRTFHFLVDLGGWLILLIYNKLDIQKITWIWWCLKFIYEQRRKLITTVHANLVFQACISFLRFSSKHTYANAGSFLSRCTGVYLDFEAFQTSVTHFCFCLVRINMPLLTWFSGAWGQRLFEDDLDKER